MIKAIKAWFKKRKTVDDPYSKYMAEAFNNEEMDIAIKRQMSRHQGEGIPCEANTKQGWEESNPVEDIRNLTDRIRGAGHE